ncbi:hypothetical protein MBLNU459_g3049t1 [Dothideomycetes sp. NU459]
MFLPSHAAIDTPALHPLAYGPLSTHGPHEQGPAIGRWHSIIGIVTAIVGNVLISFALNTQRYAHIRLSRERTQQEEKSAAGNSRGPHANYGTQHSRTADERAKGNAPSPRNQDEGADYDVDRADASESDPLIPSPGSRKSSRSSSSESTVRPDKRAASSAAEKSYLNSPYWWLGIALMTVGEAGNFLAYGFAPASIVAPLGVVALVSNCLIAPLMLHERFRKRDALGVIIASGGCVTVVLSASGSNPKLGPDEIWDQVTTWEFETYLGITVALIIALMAASNKYGGRTILVDLGLVGLFGGYTALSTKGVASLLSNTIWRAITFPITYLLVLILATTAILQIKYLNRALSRFDSTQVIPTQFVLFTLSVIIGSAVLYRDFEKKTAKDAIEFVAGCALTFSGVWLITSGRSRQEDGDEEEEEVLEGDTDAINLADEEHQQPEIRQRDDSDVRHNSLHPPSIRRLKSSVSDTPSLVITASEDMDDQPFTFEALSDMEQNPWSTGPAPGDMSAIHASSTSKLPQDPKKSNPPQMHATTSAPILPTTSTIRLSTPERRPQTPTRYISSPAYALRQTASTSPSKTLHTIDPSDATPSRFSTLPRHGGIAGMLPGPLVTPLSSSLSAIVANSLRRGVDVGPGPLSRRRTSGRKSLRPRRSAADGVASGSAIDDHDATPGLSGVSFRGEPRATDDNNSAGDASKGGRARSLSNTLGDLFRVKRARTGTLESGEDDRGQV